MKKTRLTAVLLVSFLCTVGLLWWWQEPVYPDELWAALGVFALLSAGAALKWRSALLVCCAVLGIVGGFLRVMQTTHVSTVESVESYAWDEETVLLHGVVVAEPDRRPMQTKYTVKVDELSTASGEVIAVRGRVLVTDRNQWPHHAYGDEVRVHGRLEQPGKIEHFHYDHYLSRFGIYSVMYRAKIDTISSGHGSALLAKLYALKERFESKINRLYGEPHASLMAGLLTGSRRGIPAHLLQDFQATGLTHIIAISGYNITIVLTAVSAALFVVPLRWRFVPMVLAVLFFTLFVGASPSVVRAAIMGCLGLLALQNGRRTHALIAVLVAAVLMTAVNPKILWVDAGFQLSFLAVLGLTFLAPLLERPLATIPSLVREPLIMTIAAQLTAVPLVVLLFGNLSLVAPLANVLVAPLIPLGMLFGFVGTVVSVFAFPLGQVLAYIGWGMLELIIIIANVLGSLPHALLSVPMFSPWVIAVYYALLFLVVTMCTRIHGDLRV